MFNRSWKKIVATISMLALQTSFASASVTMVNTRVIYPSNVREVSFDLSNQDNNPNVIQLWVDSSDITSTPDNADAPFVVSPPMFRMEPKVNQTVRITFTGADLPQDRESVFYLNMVQIPPVDAANADQNQMLVMLRNRAKLFYRPSTIKGKVENVADQLRFHIKQVGAAWRISAENSSGYFISLISGSVGSGTQESLFTPSMIAPSSSADWELKNFKFDAQQPARVKFSFINDYGGVSDGESTILSATLPAVK